MPDPRVAPYGSWASPTSAAAVAQGGVRLQELALDGADLYWVESRPTEGGRSVLMRDDGSGGTDVTPEGFNVRTRVHEYGGGAQLVHRGVVFFTNYADQRLYRQDPGGALRPITAEPAIAAGDRFAAMAATPDGETLIAIRERHRAEGEPINEIVALPADGSAEPRPIVSGADFYAYPRPSPDGRRLAWTTWDHPRMPWDGTELWVGDLDTDGAVSGARRVAGGPDESIFQPEWSPAGVLHFVSDRSGWWNLYRLSEDGEIGPLAPMEAEFGVPQWGLGQTTYAFLATGDAVCRVQRPEGDALALIHPDGALEWIEAPGSAIDDSVRAAGDRVAIMAASAESPEAVMSARAGDWTWSVARRSRSNEIDPRYVSVPRAIEFPTEGGMTAHAFFYAPANADFRAPAGERPPLVVFSHGGPTAATSPAFSPAIQFWTSRGFAVVDVNYGGSTGYGRAYRQRLNGNWGIVDTADCINAARTLVERGEADGARLAIRGGSAGGYTTLCALTFHDVFAAGASYYGVADAEALARDTHKFESRYLDGLIGPYPERQDLYRERSPIHHADRLSCPVILFQGLEDEIVPPAQSEMMAEAVRAKGLPVAYLAFEGEQHGFRRAETIERALEAELFFYGHVFGFAPADEIEPVPIDNRA